MRSEHDEPQPQDGKRAASFSPRDGSDADLRGRSDARWRALRRWLTARATDAAVVAAPRLSARAIGRLEALLACCGPHCPVIARIVAENMRALGVYSVEAHRAYFAQLGAHFAGALHALRCAPPSPRRHGDTEKEKQQWRTGAAGTGETAPVTTMPPELARIVSQRVELDESVARLRAAAARGHGAIVVGPHITNYLLNLARLNQEVPLTVYLRYSKGVRRRQAKERWYQASGVGWISEPAQARGPLGRLGRMSAALRAGRVLFITPDLPQKRGDGTPVRFFGREIYLPAGPAVLTLRTAAPLFMLSARMHAGRQRLEVLGPFDDEDAPWDSQALGNDTRRPSRRAAVRRRLQWFATCFEEFLKEQTPLWYLWGDKRWTRVLRSDPRYVSVADGDEVRIASGE